MFIAHEDTGLVDPVHALAIGVDQVHAFAVERVQIFVMETWTFAELAVPRLQRLGGGLVVYDGIYPGSDLFHLLVVAVVVRLGHALGREVAIGQHPIPDALRDVGPSVFHQVFVGETAGLQRGEVDQPFLLPTRLEVGKPFRIGVLIVADVDGRRRALKHEQFACAGGEMRNALDGGRACADNADSFVGQVG